MNVPILLRAAVVGLFLTGLSLAPAFGAEALLKSAGCKTEYFLLKELAQAYRQMSGTQLRTAKTGNKKAVELLLAEDIDLAFTCRPIQELSRRLNLDASRVQDWDSIPIARDPIVIVANTSNGVDDLSIEQLASIFRGDATHWSAFGGADLPIHIAHFDPGLEGGTYLLFKEFTVGATGELTPDAKTLEGPSMLGNYVSRTPGAVTFIPLSSYQKRYGDVLAIAGVHPSQQTVTDGSYPLSATYHLTVSGNRQGSVDDFIAYCTSPAGREIIARNFIPYGQTGAPER